MSVPFKFRQHFRDLFDNVSNGGKTLSREDLDAVVLHMLPAPPADFVARFGEQCPMSVDGFLTFIAEWQKDPASGGASFDDIAWGYVSGCTKHLLFQGADDADFKDIKPIVDPMLKPIKLDVGKLYTQYAVAKEGRISVEEMMQVFRGMYPPTQVSFADVYKWPKGKKSTKKFGMGLLQKAVTAFVQSENAAAAAGSPKTAGELSPQAPPIERPASPVAELPSNPVEVPPAQTFPAAAEVPLAPTPGPTVVAEAPAPSPPSHPLVPPKETVADAAAVSFSPPPSMQHAPLNPPRSTASYSDPAVSQQQPPPTNLSSSVNNVSFAEKRSEPQPSDRARSAAEGSLSQTANGTARVSSTSPVQSPYAFDRMEPPPIPQSEKQRAQAAQEQEVHSLIRGSGSSLSSLPPAVVEFINQLDQQRTDLQRELQSELEELSENSLALKTLRARLEKLQNRNSEPSFASLEPERRKLVQRMEQWVYAAKTQQQNARQGVKRINDLQKIEQAAEAMDRHQLNQAYAHAAHNQQYKQGFAPYNPQGVGYRGSVGVTSPVPMPPLLFSPYAAPSATPISDPTTRICQFFDSLTEKEREVREKQEAVDRLRSLERREKKLVNDIQRLEVVKAESLTHQKDLIDEARAIRDDYYNANARGAHQQLPMQQQQRGAANVSSSSNSFAIGGLSPVPVTAALHLTAPRREAVPPIFGDFDDNAFFTSGKQGRTGQQPQQKLRPGSANPQNPFAISPHNPFLAASIAEQQRTLGGATSQVTRRLEEMITAGEQRGGNKYSGSRVVPKY